MTGSAMADKKPQKIRTNTQTIPDWHLWSEVTRTVSPLPRRPSPNLEKIALPQKLTSAEQSQRRHQAALNNKKTKSEIRTTWSPNSVPHQQRSTGAYGNQPHLPNIEPRMHRRVRRGQLPIDATIDLHGLHQSEARSALYRFVQTRYAHGDRTLLIITGKGLKKTGYGAIEQKGVLRHMLPIWLKEPGLAATIAGFEVSARTHGGEGAYYVRLRQVKS